MPNSYETYLKSMDVFPICILYWDFLFFFFLLDSSQTALVGVLQYPEAHNVMLSLKK